MSPRIPWVLNKALSRAKISFQSDARSTDINGSLRSPSSFQEAHVLVELEFPKVSLATGPSLPVSPALNFGARCHTMADVSRFVSYMPESWQKIVGWIEILNTAFYHNHRCGLLVHNSFHSLLGKLKNPRQGMQLLHKALKTCFPS